MHFVKDTKSYFDIFVVMFLSGVLLEPQELKHHE